MHAKITAKAMYPFPPIEWDEFLKFWVLSIGDPSMYERLGRILHNSSMCIWIVCSLTSMMYCATGVQHKTRIRSNYFHPYWGCRMRYVDHVMIDTECSVSNTVTMQEARPGQPISGTNVLMSTLVRALFGCGFQVKTQYAYWKGSYSQAFTGYR